MHHIGMNSHSQRESLLASLVIALAITIYSPIYGQTLDKTNDPSTWVWRGMVKSKSGEPIEGVLVSSPPSLTSGVKTRVDGSFDLRITKYSSLVYFWHPDYRPFAQATNQMAFKDRVDVVLERGAETLWNIPACSTVKRPDLYVGIGSNLRVRVPRGTYVISGFSDEFAYYHIRYSNVSNLGGKEWLQLYDKPAGAVRGYYLMEDIGMGANRSWKSGSVLGVDRGRGGNRYVVGKNGGSFITYLTNIREAAAEFDKIIDKACYEKIPARSYLKNSGALKVFIKTVRPGRRPGVEIELTPYSPLHAQPSVYRSSAHKSGRFTLSNLPSGSYILTTEDLHRKYKRVIHIKSGRTSAITLNVLPIAKKDTDNLLKSPLRPH